MKSCTVDLLLDPILIGLESISCPIPNDLLFNPKSLILKKYLPNLEEQNLSTVPIIGDRIPLVACVSPIS